MLKRILVGAMFLVWMTGVSGCGNQADYDAKVTEVNELTTKLTATEAKAAELEQNLDALKGEVEKAKKTEDDALAKIKDMELAKTDLKMRIKTLEEINKSLKAKASELQGLKAKVTQLQKDLAATKKKLQEAEKAKRDAESWEITHGPNGEHVHTVKLSHVEGNRYRLVPKSLAFSGVYEFDGTKLSMVAENPGYPDLAWSKKGPGLFEMVGDDYKGALMRRKAAGGPSPKP
ncbi:MAG: hypothetical protein JW888_06380 [Pirellulales bacterium]|nr:hypothetical protein [Pirellulales bacterium]